MIKRSFFGFIKPEMKYDILEASSLKPLAIPVPKTVTLLVNTSRHQNTPSNIRVGENVLTGQKLSPYGLNDSYVISSVSGIISSISPYTGDYGKTYDAITIDVDTNEVFDETFKDVRETLTSETALDHFAYLPGNLPIDIFRQNEKPIQKIIVYGGNTDLLITTNQYIIKMECDFIAKGINVLKALTGIDNVTIAVPRELLQGLGHTGADLKAVDLDYPSANPYLVMQNVFNQVIPAGETIENSGVCFLSAEAVAAVGKAMITGRLSVRKILTLVGKNGNKRLVSAVIGTPVKDIFEACGIQYHDKDRLIIGGPLTGSSIYSLHYPVQTDTDAIMIQDASTISFHQDNPCINCGECVRICPATIPINMLVRFLEAGKFEEAVDLYDLYSCIECGLCGFVCISRIPIFQLIKLAKYQLSMIIQQPDTVEAQDE